ncbi:hypothetical protein Q1695_014316 [Nippostrongylus brasiliensis]|nr:hypothetical protein Q1695_014316 [Nippostrongylus brasiliensis]
MQAGSHRFLTAEGCCGQFSGRKILRQEHMKSCASLDRSTTLHLCPSVCGFYPGLPFPGNKRKVRGASGDKARQSEACRKKKE